jgi:DNA recombination protein RmuC
MTTEQLILYVLIGISVLILIFNLILIIKINTMNSLNKDNKRELNDYKFSQQTHYMNMQKTLNEEFSVLKENIMGHINKYNERTVKEILTFHNKMNYDIYQFKDTIQKEMFSNFEKINRNMNENLEKMNDKVDMRLNEGFERTNKTFNSVLERLSKIDEAQKKIESLSTNILSLQDVLTDKKARGTFGEVQLKQILTSIFGENNKKIFELQKQLSNNKIVDAILYTPEPLGNICIDSKFPLENYKRMINRESSEYEQVESEKLFKQDVKNHINAIKDKYILPNETSSSAIMFVPAEAIFAEINAYHSDLIEYSQKTNVWIASPTTLMFLLTTVQVILRNVERDKYAKVIHDELNRLGTEFKRYKERWDRLSKNIDQVSRNVKELYTTSDKIERHFDSISKVDLKKLDIEDPITLDLIDEED